MASRSRCILKSWRNFTISGALLYSVFDLQICGRCTTFKQFFACKLLAVSQTTLVQQGHPLCVKVLAIKRNLEIIRYVLTILSTSQPLRLLNLWLAAARLRTCEVLDAKSKGLLSPSVRDATIYRRLNHIMLSLSLSRQFCVESCLLVNAGYRCLKFVVERI